MLCKECKENIDIGDACVTDHENGRTQYFHVGCNLRRKEEAKNEDEEFERIAQLARTVH